MEHRKVAVVVKAQSPIGILFHSITYQRKVKSLRSFLFHFVDYLPYYYRKNTQFLAFLYDSSKEIVQKEHHSLLLDMSSASFLP